MSHNVPDREEFEIAILCALEVETKAVLEIFDYKWTDGEDGEDGVGKHEFDENTYTAGRIEETNVVLVYSSAYGKTSTTAIGRDLKLSFKNIKKFFIVGVCGGAPKADGDDVLLGDVIISTELKKYDEGKQYPDRFRATGCRVPAPDMGGFLRKLKLEDRERLIKLCSGNLKKCFNHSSWQCPGPQADKLYESNFLHKHHDQSLYCQCRGTQSEVCSAAEKATCEDLNCCPTRLVPRDRLKKMVKTSSADANLLIHFGAVASGDTVMKSGEDRDLKVKEFSVIGFEMEGAGVPESFSSVVIIKGVCDYADSHKRKEWQPYASATAAACMKAVLRRMHDASGSSRKRHRLGAALGLRSNPRKTGSKSIFSSKKPSSRLKDLHHGYETEPSESERDTQEYDIARKDKRATTVISQPPEETVTAHRQLESPYSRSLPVGRSQDSSYGSQPSLVDTLVDTIEDGSNAEEVSGRDVNYRFDPGSSAPQICSPTLLSSSNTEGERPLPVQSRNTFTSPIQQLFAVALRPNDVVPITTCTEVITIAGKSESKIPSSKVVADDGPFGVIEKVVNIRGEVEICLPDVDKPLVTVEVNVTEILLEPTTPTVSIPQTNPEKTNELLQACKERNLETVKHLLQDPTTIDIAATDSKGRNMLHVALGTGRVISNISKMGIIAEIIDLLCDNGIDVNAADNSGVRAIHYCAKTVNREAAIRLIGRHVDINGTDSNGRTALYYTTVDKYPDYGFVQLLIRGGAKLGRERPSPLPHRSSENQVTVRALVNRTES